MPLTEKSARTEGVTHPPTTEEFVELCRRLAASSPAGPPEVVAAWDRYAIDYAKGLVARLDPPGREAEPCP